jgi:hypothetical protein
MRGRFWAINGRLSGKATGQPVLEASLKAMAAELGVGLANWPSRFAQA